MNEDVTTYTTLGSRGRLFFTLCDMCIIQLPTQSLDGGMTEAYLETGTYVENILFRDGDAELHKGGNDVQ